MKQHLIRAIGASLLLAPIASTIGCAAGSATAGYSLEAKNAEQLDYKARKEIIDEAVATALEQSKAYTDQKLHQAQAEADASK